MPIFSPDDIPAADEVDAPSFEELAVEVAVAVRELVLSVGMGVGVTVRVVLVETISPRASI